MKRLSIALLLLTVGSQATAQSLHIDASKPAPPVREGYIKMGTSKGPGGVIGINSRYLTLNGAGWFPVMGEFHFSRYPEAEWETELLKMKAAGVTTIASYVIWNQIELEPGTLDWTGNRNLRHFVELCAKHHLYFFLRPGPWAHAETRFGGIPDWVVEKTGRRSNDPIYMAEVERFWTGVATQVRGLLWKDGGPIVGMQLENEYNLTGPGKGAEHTLALKRLALRIGLDVPLYTVTGWDNAVYPRGEVAPVDGAYVDEPWGVSMTNMSPRPAQAFRFDSVVATGLGAQTAGDAQRTPDAILDRPLAPYLGAEFGSGLPVMYRRRPIVAPDDVASTILTQMGSGLNLLGYYMFHGGANPTANGRGLEETTRSGAYNDVPKISYDFQAALGQYGDVNPVQGYLRPLHYFLDAFGDSFAKTSLRKPDRVPTGPGDLATPRIAVRSDGARGFVFMNNYVRHHAMADQSAIQFDVDTPTGPLRFPSKPVSVASGDYFFFPYDMDLGGVPLAWATAQPVTRVDGPEGALWVFTASKSVPVEFAFDPALVAPANGKSTTAAGKTVIALTPSERIQTIRTRAGGDLRILVVSNADSHRLWVVGAGAQRRLVMTDADVFATDDAIVFSQKGSPQFAVQTGPALPGGNGRRPTRRSAGALFGYTGKVASRTLPRLDVRQVRRAGEARPIDLFGPAGTGVQPAEEAHDADGVWQFTIPKESLTGVKNAWLTLDYRGDIARVFAGTTMLDDMFWDGRKWHIGLKRFAGQLGSPWQLNILPLRADAPIYLEDGVRPQFGKASQLAELRSIEIEPEYELRIPAK